MSCTQGELIFGIIGLFTLVVVLRYCVLFSSYCARIAWLEGRQRDFQSLQSVEGGGMNFLQAGGIWRRDYLKFDDAQVNRLGSKLFRSGIVGLIAMAAAAGWWAYLKDGMCGAY